jgi:hypothetical protein
MGGVVGFETVDAGGRERIKRTAASCSSWPVEIGCPETRSAGVPVQWSNVCSSRDQSIHLSLRTGIDHELAFYRCGILGCSTGKLVLNAHFSTLEAGLSETI